MATRAEVTTTYARQYKKASKKNKEVVLNEVIALTGWTHDNVGRRLLPPTPTAQG